MIHPAIATADDVRVTCPCCDGQPARYRSGPSRYADVEYVECPSCDGLGYVYPDMADDIRASGRRFWRED